MCILHPADPLGVIPGGIDTFIRGILRWAPDDLQMRLVGVTTNQSDRPPRQWTICDTGRSVFSFYPVIELRRPERRSRIPLTLRFTLSLILQRPPIEADVLEFHRIEPMLAFLRDRRPKTAFMHQNMAILRNQQSDIRWKYFPSIYYKAENILLPKLNSLFTVREDAAQAYAESYPILAERFRFIPTWMDPEVFFPFDAGERTGIRDELNREFGVSNSDRVLITVGRLDIQKDPLLLLEAYRIVHAKNPNVRLIYVGDGVLRSSLENALRQHGLTERVALAGLRPAGGVARMLQAADLFVLSSAYEGMPMCVLEALGTGLPVATTDVGEVGRVVRPGVNGAISRERTAAELAAIIEQCLANLDQYRGGPCIGAVERYTPDIILGPVYENYRQLAAQNRP